MTIGTVSGANAAAASFKAPLDMDQTTDSVSKNIRDQIANAQKQLQEISSNKEMSVEQKMKRRQEIQQQISDLNNQLRQHQIEQRKQQQEKNVWNVIWVSGQPDRFIRRACIIPQNCNYNSASVYCHSNCDGKQKQ